MLCVREHLVHQSYGDDGAAAAAWCLCRFTLLPFISVQRQFEATASSLDTFTHARLISIML